MADYFTVLNKAIDALADNTGESRRVVYDRARKALVRQLEAIDPPLSPSDITRQRLALEESIRKVEAEHANQSFGLSTFPNGERPDAPSAAPGSAPAAPRPPAAAGEFARPDVSSPASETPHAAGAPQQPPLAPPAGAVGAAPHDAPAEDTPPRDFGPNPLETAEQDSAPLASDVSVNAFRRAVADAGQLRNHAESASETARGAISEDAGKAQAPRVEPPFGADVQDPHALPADPQPPGATRAEPAFGPDTDGVSPYDDPEIERLVERSEGQSLGRLPLFIGGAVLALLIIGGGILYFVGGSGNLAGLDLGIGETASTTDDDKNAERLVSDGTEEAANDPSRIATDATRVNTRAVDTPEDAEAPLDGQPAEVATADGTTETETPAAEDGSIPVSQRAILYEESDDPALTKPDVLAGNVVWRQRANPESDTSLIADVEITIPDRDFALSMVLRENFDDAVEASNIIELTFKFPDDYKGGRVTEIPGLILKTAENAPGDLLIGTEAPIGPNIFWLALSGLSQDIVRNRALLRDREWIDVPLKFDNGQRGLIAFEKGADGRRVLDAVISSWSPQETQ